MRIASLLPSATEIVCALGARAELVGRSHECDFPAGLEDVPVLTSARICPLPSSRAIDRAVRDVLADALAIYEIDVERLRQARPDVVVTQDLCDVCAVSLDDVRVAVARLARQDVAIVNLHPMRLCDIWDDIARVGNAIGRGDAARQVIAALRARVGQVARRAEALAARPRVVTIEWIAPVMIGGMWMPELVSLAGGTPLVTHPGQQAPTLDLARLAALEPDVVLVKPCGFSLSRTLEELDVLRETLPRSWRARICVADGNAYFNRPGPRIVESLEILAACVHPEAFPDFAAKHAGSFTALS
ncbi:MAG TPA: ABC transporter substrate-binding protein [Myxococcales bacterium]|nr:ABC transporter substrate-binding protein [Myxococcales bacterium]